MDNDGVLAIEVPDNVTRSPLIFEKLQASNLLLGSLLGRSEARINMPGGCDMGSTMDLHLKGLQALGAK